MDALLQDLRYACRTLLKNPGFAALTILCLALGVGVNSTIFSVVDTVAIRPLPFRDAHELVSLRTTHQANGIDAGGVSFLDVRDWRERTHSFSDIATFTGRSLTLSDGDEPERFAGATVTWNMFPMLGVQPILGRQFRPDEDTPGAPRVVLLSHGVWQRRYGGDKGIIGRTITVNGDAHTVVGVMPPKFAFPNQVQLWIPQTPIEYASPRSARNLGAFARMKSGVSFEEARRDIGAVAGQLDKSSPTIRAGAPTRCTLRDDMIPPEITRVVMTMMGAVSLVLLHLVRQRREPAARARHRPSSRDRGSLGARRRARPHRAPAADGERADRAGELRRSASPSRMSACTGSPRRSRRTAIRRTTSTGAMNPRIVVYTVAIAALTGVVFGLAPRCAGGAREPPGRAQGSAVAAAPAAAATGCAARWSWPKSPCRWCCWSARRCSCAAS